MADESFQERSEAPTDKRRSEARGKGSVSKSTEINSVLVLLVGLIMLRVSGPWMVDELQGLHRYYFGMISNPEMSITVLVNMIAHGLAFTGKLLLPISAALVAVGLFANYVQIGWLFTWEPLIPKFSKLNPIAGAARLFQMRSLVELLKSILKLLLIGGIAYSTIKGEFFHFLNLADTGVGAIWSYTAATAYKVVMRITMALLVLAILDFFYQRWEYEKNLKMTKEEVKEERKQMEGDPHVKSRIRGIQREMARRRMMREVPQATVVVTNPTYIAIAIRYEPGEMETPKVLAKGKRLIAERIRALATQHQIPIVEDKPLARAMYDKVEPGDDLPYEFFTAVAEILAYVYRLKGRAAA